MSEHIDEQISEFIDDEMSADECDFFVRRLQRDSAARARYVRFQVIGAAVRGEHLAFNAAAASRRRAEPESAAPVTPRRLVAAAGGIEVLAGIAASLALVAVFAFRTVGLDVGDDEFLAGATGNAVNPFGVSTRNLPRQQPSLESDVMGMQYLMQHTGFTTGLTRTIMHSSVISGPLPEAGEDPQQDAF